MFATLLTWMQEHKQPVFLVATANDIEALPPELLRKGRFDEIFFVGLPDKKTRREIFAIHLKKRKRDPKQFDLDALAEAAEGFSGSEIEQAVIAALHEAFSKGSELDMETLLRLVRSSVPLSVTMRERIEALYQWAQGRVIWAD
jgi:SpoVK/Ycf46/Vps4 family AAA+-type ATPase